jgi:hypothetical protein
MFLENAIGEIKQDITYKLQLIKRESTFEEDEEEEENIINSRLKNLLPLNPVLNFQKKYTIRVYELKFVKGVFHEV